MRVSELIDTEQKKWNEETLKCLFTESDLKIIQRQRPWPDRPDTFIWNETKNGIYSVKTGYNLYCEIKRKTPTLLEDFEPSSNELCQMIWNLKAPHKIKVFAWKVLKGAVAVSEQLRNKGINVEKGCYLCQQEDETVCHMLFNCQVARQTWAMANIPTMLGGFTNSIFTNLHHILLQTRNRKLPEEVQEVPFWIIWTLWKNRNKNIFEGKRYSAKEIAEKAFEDARQWKLAQTSDDQELELQETKQRIWRPIQEGRSKCNIGFSWSKQTGVAGAAWILRDSEGKTLMHSRRAYNQVKSIFESKILSWEWAMESMKSLKKTNITFAATTMEIIKALNNLQQWPAFAGFVDSLLDLADSQTGWDLLYEPTKANQAAFSIAKSVTGDGRMNSYVAQGAPDWLKELLEKERAEGRNQGT